ncbi:hypothetical protein M501DRAFT_440654 [Patellaria atrata CBS 101060]|uniref:Uncharacterized protein n=1 Tax=Patellaria atrata CBS 101060 TaxID=1346257 RepID=A0A9P4S3J7_9PEZI|nr:hypothetical protein M501DRAFT_440654 [Patellaria atrata CBS 101060]
MPTSINKFKENFNHMFVFIFMVTYNFIQGAFSECCQRQIPLQYAEHQPKKSKGLQRESLIRTFGAQMHRSRCRQTQKDFGSFRPTFPCSTSTSVFVTTCTLLLNG